MRKVNSTESSLEENYNPLILPEKKREITGEIPDLNNKKNKKTITFSNQPRVTTGRQKAEDCIQNTPGVSLFKTDDLLQHIVSCTIKKMKILPPAEKYPEKAYAKLIDIVDLRAFLDIVYMRGLYHMNRH